MTDNDQSECLISLLVISILFSYFFQFRDYNITT